jgi:fatty acid desaturase
MAPAQDNPHGHLSKAQIEALGSELMALRARVTGELGERDARHIRNIVRLHRRAEIAGRALLIAGVVPPAWLAGVALLSLSKILENMEIGHNVLHGQYDWMRDPALSSMRYEWDWACPARDWRHCHNFVHHTFTNIIGKDRDIGYGLLRMADEQPWHPARLAQPLYALLQMLTFEWAVAVHDLELDRVLSGDKSMRELWRESASMRDKARRQLIKEFVLLPLLAGPAAPFVFAGNLSANVLRNVWAFLVIFCGHFPDGVQTYPPDTDERETRGAWFVRQIGGSANIEGPRWFHVLSGHLSFQIEHHLFPDLPSSRYAEIAPDVRALCRRYGIAYNTGPFTRQLGSAVARIFRCALPPARAGRSTVMAAKPGALRSSVMRRPGAIDVGGQAQPST